MRIITRTGLAAMLSIWASGLLAQSVELQRARIVTERQGIMFSLQDIFWPLMDVRTGKSEDYAGAADAAAQVAGYIDAFAALLEPGTAQGEAPGSRAKPDLWELPEVVEAAVEALKERAADLGVAANAGDAGAYASAFDDFSAACTTCHELRPSAGGVFRFAKGEGPSAQSDGG